MPSADWYFDFISPFAYLQSERLPLLADRLRIRYRPVLFAALLDAMGQKGPAEIPGKRAFTYKFVVWQARRQRIALKFPHEHPFNPLRLLRRRFLTPTGRRLKLRTPISRRAVDLYLRVRSSRTRAFRESPVN